MNNDANVHSDDNDDDDDAANALIDSYNLPGGGILDPEGSNNTHTPTTPPERSMI